ncbi:hypothetical protein [Wolbachia endosymbiont of Wuchereria bancrofti]|uniref:hypothetical protein n=1 Tax=Wolbachia endosymbiont of Wuchereria bancrofti TaxID=96496 RepID=UPI000B4DA876|nr:hypothetical protein [Wolbachia endosymbiont of Wuchereria bancrofti]
MHGDKGFKGMEEWKLRNEKGEGGGIVVRVKGARYDDHNDVARRIQEREREHQSNQPSSSMGGCYSSGASSSQKR